MFNLNSEVVTRSILPDQYNCELLNKVVMTSLNFCFLNSYQKTEIWLIGQPGEKLAKVVLPAADQWCYKDFHLASEERERDCYR